MSQCTLRSVDHAAFDELLFDEIARERRPAADSARANRELDFAGKLRVLALLAGPNLVPQGSRDRLNAPAHLRAA
jgi:hypothetical protein